MAYNQNIQNWNHHIDIVQSITQFIQKKYVAIKKNKKKPEDVQPNYFYNTDLCNYSQRTMGVIALMSTFQNIVQTPFMLSDISYIFNQKYSELFYHCMNHTVPFVKQFIMNTFSHHVIAHQLQKVYTVTRDDIDRMKIEEIDQEEFVELEDK